MRLQSLDPKETCCNRRIAISLVSVVSGTSSPDLNFRMEFMLWKYLITRGGIVMGMSLVGLHPESFLDKLVRATRDGTAVNSSTAPLSACTLTEIANNVPGYYSCESTSRTYSSCELKKWRCFSI